MGFHAPSPRHFEPGSGRLVRPAGVGCLWLLLGCSPPIAPTPVAIARAADDGSTPVDICSYTFPKNESGWRNRPAWQPWNCSNGLPAVGAFSLGEGENGAGTSGQVVCEEDSAWHYNQPWEDGATSGTARCLYIPGPDAPVQPSPAMTRCSFEFTDLATGWRYHDWTDADCSNGLPAAASVAIGQGQNAGGTQGQVMCFPDHGQHYNEPTVNGATTGVVTCVFVAPTQIDAPDVTLCSYTFDNDATGWRSHEWTTGDCSHGLPGSNWASIGQAQNGNGTVGQVACSPQFGNHYNQPAKNGATTGTVTCLFARRPPPGCTVATPLDPSVDVTADVQDSYTYDLDSDGVKDTVLFGITTCSDDPSQHCLIVDSCLFSPQQREIVLHPDAFVAGNGSAYLHDIDQRRPTSDLTGDGLQEVSVVYARQPDLSTDQQIGLTVVDLDPPDGQSILGDVVSPEGLVSFTGDYSLGANMFYPADPQGRTYPFLVPGYGDSDVDCPNNGTPCPTTWGYGCLFRYDPTAPTGTTPFPASGSGRCSSANFIEVNTAPSGPPGFDPWFREDDGYLQDLDGDGWDDVTLLYHFRAYTISGQTGIPAATPFVQDTVYDVFNGWTYPESFPAYSPVGFHGGRNYGSHLADEGLNANGDPVLRTIMVGGSPVGSFDPFCGVSRWIGVLESQPGQPSTRRLAWSEYFGFADNTVAVTPGSGGQCSCGLVDGGVGDFVNGCIHRFSDSTTVLDGNEVIAFNYFVATDPPTAENPQCLAEQCEYAETCLTSSCGSCDTTPWLDCIDGDVTTHGAWNFTVRRATDGAALTGSTNTYVWGRGNGILPNGEWAYLPQFLGISVPMNLYNVPTPALPVYTLVDDSWASRGTLPHPGRPHLTQRYHVQHRPNLIGDDSTIAELTLKDIDGDGLLDVMVEISFGESGPTCEWAGYSLAAGGFVTKTGDPRGVNFDCYDYPFDHSGNP